MSRRDRKLQRHVVLQPGQMIEVDGTVIGDCSMLDVSAGGARLRTPDVARVPDQFVLVLSPIEPRVQRRCSVVWRDKADVGVRFVA